jgi:hypothetical protein
MKSLKMARKAMIGPGGDNEAAAGPRLDRGEVIERVRRHLRSCSVVADAEAVVDVVLLELSRQGREFAR